MANFYNWTDVYPWIHMSMKYEVNFQNQHTKLHKNMAIILTVRHHLVRDTSLKFNDESIETERWVHTLHLLTSDISFSPHRLTVFINLAILNWKLLLLGTSLRLIVVCAYSCIFGLVLCRLRSIYSLSGKFIFYQILSVRQKSANKSSDLSWWKFPYNSLGNALGWRKGAQDIGGVKGEKHQSTCAAIFLGWKNFLRKIHTFQSKVLYGKLWQVDHELI